MHQPLPRISFAHIREHEGSQHRAWEELGYLLVPDMERLPLGTRLERRSAPDGGIEFSCSAPTGRGEGTWAWQAKYLAKLDDSALQQMGESFFAAVKSTADLTRYAFILPVDRSAGAVPGRMSALDKWKSAVARWQQKAADDGQEVDIVYLGHSDVLAALQLDRHAGAVRYFFDHALFASDFFRHQVQREIHNLGERYDPEVHVDVDIGDYLDSVARTPAFASRVASAVEEAGTAARRLVDPGVSAEARVAEVEKAGEAALLLAQTLRDCAARLVQPDEEVLPELVAAIDDVVGALNAVEVSTETQLRELPAPPVASPRSRPGRRARPPATIPDPASGVRQSLYELRARSSRAQYAAQRARDLLTSDIAKVATGAALLLTGPAGCGKSHLVADGARRRTERGRPTLLLLGQHLGAGSLWPQLSGQLDLVLSGRELLAALSVAAQVRGEGRALLVVDAINEGVGADLWRDQLAGFLADVAAHPWIALVITVRDTYRQDVLPPSLLGVTEVIHPGLAGHEEEALHQYAAHYELRLPDFPPMLPELTNPLFLRSMCRSVRARGLDAIPREAVSLSWVFDGLLMAANAAISRPQRLDRDGGDRIVQRAVSALAQALLEADEEHLAYNKARDVCGDIHPELRSSRSLITAMIAEGLLLRERVTTHGQGIPSDRVRFTYQRMADHVRAETLLERHSDDAALRAAVEEFCTDGVPWHRRGLLEALVLITGERRDVELAVLLELTPSAVAGDDVQRPLARVLADAFFATLVWRDPASLDDGALDLLQRYLESGAIERTRWLTLLLTVACVPKHPLNVRRLDPTLRRMSLAERDLHWSDDLMIIADYDGNPVSRTIDWALSCPSTVRADVVELAATLLSWVTTSPNRRLRDTATKALLHITIDDSAVLTRLVRGLEEVDDPYVHERVLAVACGHAVHRHHAPLDVESRRGLLDLGRAIFDIAFAKDGQAHLLTRHYARTAVEIIDGLLRQAGGEIDRDLAAAQPPYATSWPLTAPSKREIAAAYGRRPSRHLSSVTEFGMDFEDKTIRYLVGDFVLPNQARLQAARQAGLTRRRNRLLSQLMPALQENPDVAGRIQILLDDTDARVQINGWRELLAFAPAQLHAQLQALRNVTPRAIPDGADPVRPDVDLVGRWIAQRVVDLGWNREDFEQIDRVLGRTRAGEVERYAEKYGWIAFFEVAGRLADHCMVQQSWSGTPLPYDGPWQLGYVEDFDPTSTLRGDQPPDGSAASRLRVQHIDNVRRDAWWLGGDRHELLRSGDDDYWLRDRTDMPEPLALASVIDDHGDPWTVLDFATTWGVPFSPGAPATLYNQDRRQVPVRVKSMLIPTSQRDAVVSWAARQRWDDVREPEQIHPHAPFLKGYPDLERWPSLLQQVFEEYGAPGGWTTLRTAGSGVLAASATASCANRADNDFSNREYGTVLLPAPQLSAALAATWCPPRVAAGADLGLGHYETEHAWCAGDRVVAFSSDSPTFGGAAGFFVRRDALHAALAVMDAALVTSVYVEKIYWRANEPSPDRGELHAVLRHTSSGPQVTSVVHVAQVWIGRERVEQAVG